MLENVADCRHARIECGKFAPADAHANRKRNNKRRARGVILGSCHCRHHPEFVKQVMDGLVGYYGILGRRAIRAGIDIIRIGDDIGGQNGLLLSLKMWRELVKPAVRRLIEDFKQENPDIVVKYHSCAHLTNASHVDIIQ